MGAVGLDASGSSGTVGSREYWASVGVKIRDPKTMIGQREIEQGTGGFRGMGEGVEDVDEGRLERSDQRAVEGVDKERGLRQDSLAPF